MKYSCEIIKDLLPLYIDGVCTDESRCAVKTHLESCPLCKENYEAMKATDGFPSGEAPALREAKTAAGLKKVKSKLRKRIKAVLIGAAAAIAAFYVLFNVPVKRIDEAAVKVSANVYPISELMQASRDDSSYELKIPSMQDAEIIVSKKDAQSDGFVTVICTSSDYFLRAVDWEIKGDTVYISAFRTTLLCNKAQSHQTSMTSLEFREINKIVFTGNKNETVLWQR